MTVFATAEPIGFAWVGGEVTLGYLGRFRWRVHHEEGVVEARDAAHAAAVVLERVFREPTPERAPIEVRVGAQMSSLQPDARRAGGWTYASASVRFDVGGHDALLAFVTDLLARNAETAWAVGIEPVQAVALGAAFSFEAFATAPDVDALCRKLASALTQRLSESPHPATAFETAMLELKGLGHDLWSWDPGELWSHDYMTRRPGAGLTITRTSPDDDDDDTSYRVEVDFTPRA